MKYDFILNDKSHAGQGDRAKSNIPPLGQLVGESVAFPG